MNLTETMLPPGTVFLRKITNFEKGNLISPSTQTTVTPLAPSNVSAIENGTIITITATVFIDAADQVTSLDIYLTEELINGDTQGVYIDYNYLEEIPESLYPYTFSFDIENPTNSITKIESYLWDEDPVGSRGTITTVDHGN